MLTPESHLLEVALRRGLHDLATRDRASGERDLVDVHVRRERCTAYGAKRRHRVHHAGWEADVIALVGVALY